jgi:hypothetical protein
MPGYSNHRDSPKLCTFSVYTASHEIRGGVDLSRLSPGATEDFMKRSVVFFMSAALVMSGALVGRAQQKENSTVDFSFTMQNTSGTMLLACEHGCAWKTLQWRGRSGTDVSIDDSGMVGADREEGNSTFLVSIHAGDGKMELSCRRGCAWTALSYASLSARAKIDGSGVSIQ